MKRLEKKSTEENIRTTLIDNTINRNVDLAQMISIIENIGDGYSIALNSKWGTGKTFFVKQIKLVLDSYNPNIMKTHEEVEAVMDVCKKNGINIKKPYLTVYYDAWKNDNDADPVLSIIYSIVKDCMGDADDFKKHSYSEFFYEIADLISNAKFGIGIGNLLKSIHKTDLLTVIRQEKDLQERIEEFLDSLLPEKANHLLIIIDELDRCTPSYAVMLLERIKHYFDNDKITFLFATNLHELAQSVKHFYGDDFDSTGYLDRFFDIVLELPGVDKTTYFKHIIGEGDHFVFDKMCCEVIKYFDFGMRETTRFYTLVKSVSYSPTHNRDDIRDPERKANKFVLEIYLPVLIGLRMKNHNLYREFVEGRGRNVLSDMFLILCFTL